MISTLDAEKEQIYDRNIRFLGLNTQMKILETKILVVGVTGLCCEVIKNLILAGIGKIYLMDDQITTKMDLKANFFLSKKCIGENRAIALLERMHELFPNSELEVIEGQSSTIDTGLLKSKGIHSVMAFNRPIKEQKCLNDICRNAAVCFFSGTNYGLYSFFFQDLLEIEYVIIENEKPEKKKLIYSPLSKIFEKFDWSKARCSSTLLAMEVLSVFQDKKMKMPDDEIEFETFWKQEILQNNIPSTEIEQSLMLEIIKNAKAGEFNVTSAIVGGVAAQEVLKSIAKNSETVFNFFVFCGIVPNVCGYAEKIGVKE